MFSSLGSPMFPQRAIPDIKENRKDYNKIDDDGSLLATHGGMITLVALTISGFLLYTYFKGNTNWTKIEKEIADSAVIEPYEMQEIRYNSNLKLKDYIHIMSVVLTKYELDASKETKMSYVEFVELVKAQLGEGSFRSSYLIDRVVYTKILRDAQKKGNNVSTDSMSITFLLVLLTLFMTLNTSTDRAIALFKIACIIQQIKDGKTGQTHHKDYLNIDHKNPKAIGLPVVTMILDHLIEIDQVPSEKLVIENGLKYPIKEFRKKNAGDIIHVFYNDSMKEKEKIEVYHSFGI